MLRISDRGIAFIARHEGLRLSLYKDQAGFATIGFGHKVKSGEKFGSPISSADAQALFRADILVAEEAVQQHVQVALTQTQYDALVSFVFNVGGSAFATSTLLKQLNAGNYRKAADELLRWNKIRVKEKLTQSAGLAARRAAERQMFVE